MREDFHAGDRSVRTVRFGDAVVVLFVLVQGLDGAFTCLGVRTWGSGIEANPVIGAVVHTAGLAGGLTAAKLAACALGMLLHARRVHSAVAALTALYVAAAILPWTALFLTH